MQVELLIDCPFQVSTHHIQTTLFFFKALTLDKYRCIPEIDNCLLMVYLKILIQNIGALEVLKAVAAGTIFMWIRELHFA